MVRPLLEEKAQKNSHFWDTLLHRQKISPRIETKVLSAIEVSSKTKAAMRALEEAKGAGRYEQVDFKAFNLQVKAVRIVSPPQKNLYGSAFNEVFRELQAHNIPVFVDAHAIMRFGGSGYVFKEGFGADKKAAFFIAPLSGNIVVRHELQHIRDFIINYDQYIQALPEVPETMINLLERSIAGENLEKKDYKMFKAAMGVEWGLSEARASEASLQSIFTAKGFREIVATKTWHWEMFAYFNELLNASRANVKLLESLKRGQISYPHKLKATSKAVAFLIAVPALVGLASGGIFYTLTILM